MEVGGQLYAAGKNPGNLGATQSRFRRIRKISSPPEFEPRTVQPVASRHTDYATPVHQLSMYGSILSWRSTLPERGKFKIKKKKKEF